MNSFAINHKNWWKALPVEERISRYEGHWELLQKDLPENKIFFPNLNNKKIDCLERLMKYRIEKIYRDHC